MGWDQAATTVWIVLEPVMKGSSVTYQIHALYDNRKAADDHVGVARLMNEAIYLEVQRWQVNQAVLK